MAEEIRIYYESIEQANNFIKPLIENELKRIKNKVEIKLVKLKGNQRYYSKKVAPIIFLKNPDILITIVKDKIEYPLIQIEFSNAVFTEDHELQRFDGLVASAENNCIYVKISPLKKKSPSEHGGRTNFDYIGPFSLIYKKFKKMFYHFDWECDKNGNLIVDDTYLSCPKKVKDFDVFINEIVSFSLKEKLKNDWMHKFEENLTKKSTFKEWKIKLQSFKLPNLNELKSSRTAYNEKKELILKLNRFGHAMDPERGMLAYYGVLHKKVVSKMIFDEANKAWYKDIPKTKEIEDYIKSKGLKEGIDFLYCFMLGSGLYTNDDFYRIVQGIKNQKSDIKEINLTNFLENNYAILSKAMRTIFRFSGSLLITDKENKIRFKLFWKKVNFNQDYKNFPDSTIISERKYLDEDDITYLMVHQVLRPNNYKILAVSYPGAQSDRVILVAPGTGRTQERKYIDIISYLPNKITSLQENKGKYSPSEIQYEINCLSKYKNEKDYMQGAHNFIDKFDQKAPKILKIGVGFWANKNFTILKLKNLDLKKLDYFIYVTEDMQEWVLWKTGNENIFVKTKGKVSLPKTFGAT